MDADTISKIAELCRSALHEPKEYALKNGRTLLVHDKEVNAEILKVQRPERLEFSTLAALVRFCKSTDLPLGCFLHVIDYRTVTVCGLPDGADLQRTEHARACLPQKRIGEHDEPEFGGYCSQDLMIIWLHTAFHEEEDDRQELLTAMAGIDMKTVISGRDSGLAETATVKTEVGPEIVRLENPLTLHPMLSFPEIKVPMKCCLRFRCGKEKGEAGLFIAGEIAWQQAAMEEIREYLQEQLNVISMEVL